MDFASYITGFVDGERCFSVSFNRKSKLNTGIEVRPSFSVSQHKRNKKIIVQIQNFFQCGGVRFSKNDQNYKFEVRALKDLWEKIIPHFQTYPLQTQKQKDFLLFVKICTFIRKNKHLSSNYLIKIIDLAYNMNESGKRKYKKSELLTFLVR